MPDKVTKTEAHYRPHPNGDEQCNGCSMFVRNGNRINGCTAVAGIISPSGWCKLWEAKR